jgi:uncharacterized metal-binding protein YceD (DUF177 family)
MKKSKKEYIIPFSGLSLGEHTFDFVINDTFFENRPYSEIQKGNYKVNVHLTKFSSMLSLSIDIEGESEVICDKCSELFMLPTSTNNQLMVKIGLEDNNNEDEDVLFLASGEHELDIEQYLYEYIVTGIPFSRVHPEGACNMEVLKELEKIRVENYNDPENNNNETNNEIEDPWEILKQKFKN